ncbi:MAG: hypothetical protein JO072_00915 [Parafilimonas sp.]|nr:hypothetical protein [Parafilimonas sp.]
MNTPLHTILFICSSLEPGKDGVGDYTRKLACALIEHGFNTAIIALNDRRMTGNMWQGKQADNNGEVDVLRLSESLSWKKRMAVAKKLVNDLNPDWISLQYVPFGFHLKGLPFNLGEKLKQLNGKASWHIMFHELSVNRFESFKFKMWALLQVRIIRSLLFKLQPRVIHTNTELYRYRLKEINFASTVLPLFSNISRNIGNQDSFNEAMPEFIRIHRNEYIIGTLFGAFDYKRWNMQSLLNKFNYRFTQKRVAIVSIGRMPAGHHQWEELKKVYPQVLFLSLGEQSPSFISNWLSSYTDFGILTTLPELAGKSGSFMAFKEHGVPVVCTIENEGLKQLCLPLDKCLTVVREEQNFVIPKRYPPVFLLDEVVQQLIYDLKNSQQ